MAALHRAAPLAGRAWSEAEFDSLLAQPGCFALGDARAFALTRVVADEAELLLIITAPDHRRQGHARALLQTLHRAANERGAGRVFLEVAADNHAACALYRAEGYESCGRRPGYYPRDGAQPADALVMQRVLP